MADLHEKIETAVGLQPELRKILEDIVDAASNATVADGSITTAKFAADAKSPLSGTADTANSVDASGVSGTLSDTQIPNLAQTKITGLTDDLNSKLTATQGAAVADSAGTTDADTAINALLASLRAANIIATS
ncbi:hypothetical protein P4284_16050 [Bacillus swezeyi]|uniref:hypothetical protein n=1 Tax=Bacillus swezeyi TaxID=1925020 RepID=UPI002E2472E9|nr:hypothetical protein [Bacillus swezeyi]